MSVIDQLAYLSAIPAPDDIQVRSEQRSRWMWATVTQVSPLRVRLDGQSQSLDMTPISLVGGLRVNRRVRVQLVEKQLIVTGASSTDFGWTDCAIMSGFEARGVDYRPQVRRTDDGMVHFRGQMQPTGFTANATTQFMTIPAGFRPEVEVRFVAYATYRARTWGGWISVGSGVAQLQTPEAAPDVHFSLIVQPWQAA